MSQARLIWLKALPDLLSAATILSFENRYQQLATAILKQADWRTIYEKKQENWQKWIERSGIDDREKLRSVTPIPEWISTMGW